MVIDFYYHFPHQPMDEGPLSEWALAMAKNYGEGARAGLPLNAVQIAARLRDLTASDPDASRALRRRDDAGINLTVALVMDRWDICNVYPANRQTDKAVSPNIQSLSSAVK